MILRHPSLNYSEDQQYFLMVAMIVGGFWRGVLASEPPNAVVLSASGTQDIHTVGRKLSHHLYSRGVAVEELPGVNLRTARKHPTQFSNSTLLNYHM